MRYPRLFSVQTLAIYVVVAAVCSVGAYSLLSRLFPDKWERVQCDSLSVAVFSPNWMMSKGCKVVNKRDQSRYIQFEAPILMDSAEFANRHAPEPGWMKAFKRENRAFMVRRLGSESVEFTSWGNGVSIRGTIQDKHYDWNKKGSEQEEITLIVASVNRL